jgi:surface polysaccharide O-acyltransferase-like enzyme
MLQIPQDSHPVDVKPSRIAPLDRARTFVTLLVVLHHSVLNYTYFGNGDHHSWLGFDLVVLFNDSFFMAFMFLISGLFVWDELKRKGTAFFLRDRAWRLGIPFLLSIFVLMPIAYYPTFLRYHLPGTTDFNFFHFWWRTLTVGPWPSGPVWFLWVLLALDVLAAAIRSLIPGVIEAVGKLATAARDKPVALFAAFLAITIVVYVPLRLAVGDASWLEFGPVSVQTSRILLYTTFFLTGVSIGSSGPTTGLLAQDGEPARRWPLWLAIAAIFYGSILALVYIHHNFVANLNSPPLIWSAAYSLAFAGFSAAMAFTVPAIMLRSAKANWWLFDALQPSAYGVFLIHYIFIIWLQYAVYDLALPAGVKFAIVFVGTLSMSWIFTVLVRRVPFVGRMI